MAFNRQFTEKVRSRLLGRPHLFPLFSHTLDIPERLREYNENLFAVFNAETQKYEIHSLENKGDTYCFTVRFNNLDARVLREVWRNDIRVHGANLFKRIEESEQKREEKQKKDLSDFTKDFASEYRSAFARGAWGTDHKDDNYLGKPKAPKMKVAMGGK